ncbi:head-tail connector protein [Proteinivorax tanatarense]|uniref:Head-tail connector protein n=1 Tax=Proteinivorax tanatarense TaxID=1260629 RepID=A0AAU7VKA3_9FIRM
MITLEEVKLYLRVEGDEEDALIASLLTASTELCEGILRYPLTEFEEVPELVKNAVLFATASMYENREGDGIKSTFETLKNLLSPYRKESW